jgi:hypothetical protein
MDGPYATTRDKVSERIVEFLDLVKGGLDEVKENPDSTKKDLWHCNDVQEGTGLSLDPLANLVYSQATTGTF